MGSMFERREYLNRVCEILQHNYVALLGQRGTGLQTFLDTLSSPSSFSDMQFLSITMPEHVADDENLFNHTLLANLLEKIGHLPSGESLRTDIERSIENYKVMEEASTRLWLAFERLGRKTSARPLVIVLQAFSHLPPKQLNKFLLALRDYHRQINRKGEAGKHLRFLVAGDLRLWLLSFYKEDDKQTVPSSPFDYATRIFFDGLSYQEIDALHPSLDTKHAIYVKNLTDGIPDFVQKAGQLKPSSNTLRPFFRFLEKRWKRLPERSQEALKRFAENPDDTPDYNLDYDCLPIPKLSSPWLEAFWQGFLRVRLRKITWRSPIHRAFVMEQPTQVAEDISKNTMMRIHQLEGLRHFTQLISHILEEENLENYLDDALLLTFPVSGSLLAPIVKELCLGTDRQELIIQTRALVTNTDKYWLKQLLEDFDAEYDEEYFEYFLVSASIWEARRILEDFDIHFYYDDADILAVADIAKQLLIYGILPWLDRWELPLGQRVQLSSIPHSRPLAVFFGKNSTETAHLAKLEEFLSLHRRQVDAAIVVILADAPEHLQLPAVLSEAKWIDSRKRDVSLLQQLKAMIKEELVTQVQKERPYMQPSGSSVKEDMMIDRNNIVYNDQETAITNELAKIMARHVASLPGDPRDFFRMLVSSVPMPAQWRSQILGAWTIDIEYNAQQLIRWAWSKGSIPSNPPPDFTLLGSLLYFFLGRYVGRDDEARIVAAVIVSYRLCRNEELRNKIAIRYQVPQIMDSGKQSAPDADMAWRGPVPEDDTELQAKLPRKLPRLEIEFLKHAVEQANVVCCVELAKKNRYGTGFLIARDLVLTNYHVLKRYDDEDIEANARELILNFGYTTQDSGQTFKLAGETPVRQSSPTEELDFVLLQVEESIIHAEGIKVAHYSLKSLSQGMGMNIIQHPNGETMQVAMSSNGIIGVYQNTDLVQYVTDTIGGSSGAPCFNEDWEVVALHHAEKAKLFGSAGEGILFSAIHERIKDDLLSRT